MTHKEISLSRTCLEQSLLPCIKWEAASVLGQLKPWQETLRSADQGDNPYPTSMYG